METAIFSMSFNRFSCPKMTNLIRPTQGMFEIPHPDILSQEKRYNTPNEISESNPLTRI